MITAEIVAPFVETKEQASLTVRLPDGRTLSYAEFGEPTGAPVLALHGMPVSRLIFSAADAEAKARKLRLIAPDRPGYGLSTSQPGRRVLDYPADIEVLADHLSLERFAIIGLSGGAPFAMACACRLADRIAIGALISPIGPLAELGDAASLSALQRAVFGGAARSEFLARVLCRALRHLNSRRPDLAYNALIRRSAPADRGILARPAVRQILLRSLSDGLGAGVGGAARDLHLFGQPWGFTLGEVMTPCIIWQGTEDRTTPPRAAYALAHLLPVCRLDRIPGAGHFWVFDDAGRVLDAIEAGLTS